jgi:hypothetical protein
LAFRIIEVSEKTRLGRAGHNTGRLFSFLNTACAKVTLPYDTALMPGARDLFKWGESHALEVGLYLNELGSGAIGTGHDAILAPNALPLINRHNAVLLLERGSRRTHPDAFRVPAMHAEHGLIMQPTIRIFTFFPDQDPGPEDPFRGTVVLPTGQGAGMTTDAPIQINHHPVSHLRSPI